VSYGAREVAATLGVSVGQVRAFVRSGFLDPERGPRGELRFSFQDLVLLRTANELVAARIPPRRIRRALDRLRAQLPAGSPLTGVHIRAESGRIVVGDGASRWHPESGQALFDFGVAEVAGAVAPLALEEEAPLRGEPTAEEWYQFGCDLEEAEPAKAADAYRRAVELDEEHADARINLGRILHQAGRPDVAAVQYQLALDARPDDATAAFNLGVALEDMKKPERAIAAYLIAVSLDQRAADAHWNLARLYEARDDRAGALRHLRSYRKLTRR
jgi:tetratricopeptide (TPR) repeat protein